MSGNQQQNNKANPMGQEDKSRIMSANAKEPNNPGFAGRAQSAADKNQHAQNEQAKAEQSGNKQK